MGFTRRGGGVVGVPAEGEAMTEKDRMGPVVCGLIALAVAGAVAALVCAGVLYRLAGG